ncbi:MAG: chromosome segregation protein SMC [Aquificaceae bacterium]|nr:chromosome segregation protein SMC [Aquificaceae bacterium]
MHDKIEFMSRKPKKEVKIKRTTLVLPYDLWEELKIESIKKNKTMSQIVAQKLHLLKALEGKIRITEDPLSF